MREARQNRHLFHPRHERGGKTVRLHRHHSRRAHPGRWHPGGTAATGRVGKPGGHFHQSRGGTRLNLRPIGIVYRKELRDLLRDWRAILSIVIVPVVVVPIIIVAVLKLVAFTMKEQPKVMLLGGQGSPETVAALRRLDKFELVPANPD